MKNILAKILTVVFAASAMLSTNVFAANPASFTLNSSSYSVVNGDTFNVSIFENGDNVNVVTLKLAFDNTKLQLNSAICGSSFSGSQGEVNGVTCFTSGGTTVNGSILVANVSFKSLAGAGSSAISVASGSKIVTSGLNIWDQVGGSILINLITPTPAPAPVPTSTPASDTAGSTSMPVVAPTSTSQTLDNKAATPITTPVPEPVNPTDGTTQADPSNNTGSTLGVVDLKSSSKNDPVKSDSSNTVKFFDAVRIFLAIVVAAGVMAITYYYGLRSELTIQPVDKSFKKSKYHSKNRK